MTTFVNEVNKFSDPIEGYRSRLEYVFAVLMSEHNVTFDYEPVSLRRESVFYQPDFLVQAPIINMKGDPDFIDVVLEIKGAMDPEDCSKITDYSRALKEDRSFQLDGQDRLIDWFIVAFLDLKTEKATHWRYCPVLDKWVVKNGVPSILLYPFDRIYDVRDC